MQNDQDSALCDVIFDQDNDQMKYSYGTHKILS